MDFFWTYLWPLIVMLVLTQLSVGAFLIHLLLESLLDEQSAAALRPVQTLSALAFGLLALAASTLHLGRPQFAYRAVIGLKHSWLSREIVAFGAFAGAALLYAVSTWVASLSPAVFATLRWTNSSPLFLPMISLGGSRASEHPIHNISGLWMLLRCLK